MQQRPSEIELASHFFPCEECMALAGTNQDCQHCTTHYSQHYQNLIRTFKYVQSFCQPWLPSFPCPIRRTDGDNCSACTTPATLVQPTVLDALSLDNFCGKCIPPLPTQLVLTTKLVTLAMREPSLPHWRTAPMNS